MFKVDLEKAEEAQIKLPTSAGSSKKQGNSRKTSISASLTTVKSLCGSQQRKNLKEMGIALWTVTAVKKFRYLRLERKVMTNLDSIFKSQTSL